MTMPSTRASAITLIKACASGENVVGSDDICPSKSGVIWWESNYN